MSVDQLPVLGGSKLGGQTPRILVAHPSPDLYGSDLQLVETVRGLTENGCSVVVALPERGPLVERLMGAGAGVRIIEFPVLRRTALRPAGLMGLTAASMTGWFRLRRMIRQESADVVLVNTVTPPLWLAAARSLGVPTVCHVHEAETEGRRSILKALYAPLALADRVITNSDAATSALLDITPRLRSRTVRIYNGVPDPVRRDQDVERPNPNNTELVVFIGRLSPRKGPDVLLEAVARIRRRGRSTQLLIIGSAFAGYGWYENDLRTRAHLSDLAGAVSFAGYTTDPFADLPHSAILVVPSRIEPFGNVAVEANLARIPLIASAVQGLTEIVSDGVTGLLCLPDDDEALADAIAKLADDPDLALRLAESGRGRARELFGVERYRSDVATLVLDVAGVRSVPGTGKAA